MRYEVVSHKVKYPWRIRLMMWRHRRRRQRLRRKDPELYAVLTALSKRRNRSIFFGDKS